MRESAYAESRIVLQHGSDGSDSRTYGYHDADNEMENLQSQLQHLKAMAVAHHGAFLLIVSRVWELEVSYAGDA